MRNIYQKESKRSIQSKEQEHDWEQIKKNLFLTETFPFLCVCVCMLSASVVSAFVAKDSVKHNLLFSGAVVWEAQDRVYLRLAT